MRESSSPLGGARSRWRYGFGWPHPRACRPSCAPPLPWAPTGRVAQREAEQAQAATEGVDRGPFCAQMKRENPLSKVNSELLCKPEKADQGGIISRHLIAPRTGLALSDSSLCQGLRRHGPCVWHGGPWPSEPSEADCLSCGPHRTRLCPVPPTLAYSLRSLSTSVRVTRPSSLPSSETTGSRPAPC